MSAAMKELLSHLDTPVGNDIPVNLGKPASFTWRDYLLMLLKIDASIEHGLMVQYLYAAYSLGGAQVPPEKRKMVRHWQQTILSIAKEEMGHLLTVQNVITLLGGPVTFNREDYPWDSEFYPFPLELEPLTLESLSKYVYTEAPLGWGQNVGDDGDDVEHQICQRLNNSSRPPKPDVIPVAALFRAILAIVSDPQRIPESDFDPYRFDLQGTWDAWGRNYGQRSGVNTINLGEGDEKKKRTCPTDADLIIVPVATRDGVIDALKMVAEQGEDPKTDGNEKSHFRRFLEIYLQFQEHFPEGCGEKPARDVPINPTTFLETRAVNGDTAPISTPITNVMTNKWATLFNLRYRLLLTYLRHSYRLAVSKNPITAPGNYQRVEHQAFVEMYNLKSISDILVRSPLEADTDPNGPFKPAGAPFQMPYTLELPQSDVDCWMQYKDILGGCADIIAWIKEWQDDSTPYKEVEYLNALHNADQECLAWIDTVLTATQTARSTL